MSDDEKGWVYASYKAINETPGVTRVASLGVIVSRGYGTEAWRPRLRRCAT
jgi:hypothetical protein